MLSIIIASTNQQLQQEIRKNIRQTVGCIYELLIFENADGQKSICQIYNEGAKKAQFEILCFMHEDLDIKSVGWGNTVIDLFNKQTQLGVLGIAGSSYKSVTPSGWFTFSHVVELEHSNLIQSYKYTDQSTFHNSRNPSDQNPALVVAVDGVWMCTRKTIALQLPFDEQRFQKFHCYDIDFCLNIGRHYSIAITYDVLLHHYSDGNFNREWMEEVMKMHKKWSNQLPIHSIPLTKAQIREIEKQNFKHWIRQMKQHGFSLRAAFRVLHLPGVAQVLGLKYFLKYHYSIFSIYRKKDGTK